MKRVLVVDDEFLVRLGLKTTINWEAHGYVITGEASNGKEALELYDSIKPDILLTDIKMPVMDGFELIKEVRKKDKNVKIVILSHYDDFSFAQKALKFGATQYILKSEMNQENLIELLTSLSDDSFSESRNNLPASSLREEYLKEQLVGKPANDDFLPSSLSAPPGNLFDETGYFVLKGFCETSTLPEGSGEMLSKTVKMLLENTFDAPTSCSSYYKTQLYFTSIVKVKENSDNGAEANLVDGVRQLIRNIRQYFDIAVQVGISGKGTPSRFAEMIYEAESARKSCFFSMEAIGLVKDIPKPATEEVHISLTRLSSFIEEENRSLLDDYIRDVFKALVDRRNFPTFRNALIDFLSIAKSLCERYKLGQVPSLNVAKFSYENALMIPYIGTAEKYITDLYNAILDAKTSHQLVYSAAVRNCISFIKSNFASNISLSDAADAAQISASYLSLIFKEETGVNFSNYLTNFRIEQAKKMLTSTNSKIYEIADEVGFSSPYYFSKVFKEITGYTCKEYKDKYTIDDQ